MAAAPPAPRKQYTKLEAPWLVEYLSNRFPGAIINYKGRAKDVVAAVKAAQAGAERPETRIAGAGGFGAAVPATGQRIFIEYSVFSGPGAAAIEAGAGIAGLGAQVKIARLDALIPMADQLQVWEARRDPKVGILSQVERYAAMLASDPGIAALGDIKITLHLLSNVFKPAIASAARAASIEFVTYLPPWLRQIESEQADAAAAKAIARSQQRRGIANPSGASA